MEAENTPHPVRRVLIVDDTRNIRLMLSKCLELEGYHVSQAANGREALDCILEQRFRLIFLDIKLPEMSGTEVLRQMRAAGILTPVIMITAYPTIKNAVECTRLGVVSYLQKPFTAERLRNVLAELEQTGALTAEQDLLETARRAIQAGNGTIALQKLSGALATSPQDPDIYLLMSQAYALAGDRENEDKFARIAAILKG